MAMRRDGGPSAAIRRICFVGGMRFPRPLDASSIQKYAALAPLGRLSVVGFSERRRFERFTEIADFYLLPCFTHPLLRYLAMGTAGTCLVGWGVLVRGTNTIVAQSPYEGFVGAVVKRAFRLVGRRVALVVESHGDYEQDLFLQRTDLPVAPYRALMRATAAFACRHADVLRAVSSTTRGQIERAAPGRPCVQFQTWTDFGTFRRAGEERVPKPPGAPRRVLYAGGLFHRKGVHVLVDAVATLVHEGRDVQLRLAGDETDPAYAAGLKRQLDALGITDRVHFTGQLARAALAREMREADILVLPSLSDGLPRVVFEAQSAGALVIGANVGGIPDMIEDGVTGLLVPPADVAALAGRLRWALDHGDAAREIAARGRAFALESFTLDRYLQGYAAVFEYAAAAIAPRSSNRTAGAS